MAYAGTVVTRGVARGLVVATGAHTELGQIGQMMRRVERLRTPLTRRLDTVARQITIAVMAVSIAILAWGLVAQEWEFDFLVVAVVGLAVGAIPEGLTIAASEDAPQRLVVAPANAGKAIVDAVVENKRRITIGQDAKTMWALNRMNPDTAANLIYKGMKDLLS